MRVGRGTGQWILLLTAATLLSACAAGPSRAPDRDATLRLALGEFHFARDSRDPRDVELVRAAVEHAAPRLSKWGTFQDPVLLVIHPNHAALERAANRPGYDFLRAWARYEQVEVQSPRTWTRDGASQKQVDELLLHELTHSLMWQRSATASDWTRKGIPLWFSEGMASYTAGQGYRVPSLEDLSRFLHEHPDADPLAGADALYEKEEATVYGAAHHAFTFLVDRYGEGRVRAVLATMRDGQGFTGAFASAIGLPADAFLRDFRRYVFLRGFKGGRVLPPRVRPSPLQPTIRPPPSTLDTTPGAPNARR
jgi:hypothetical protein